MKQTPMIQRSNDHQTESEMEANVSAITARLKEILLKKNQDYGPLNISHAPGGPINGLRVRMYDKLARINNLYEKGGDTPNFESLEDSFIDLANYAIIGILVQNGQWSGIPDKIARANGTYEKSVNPQ